MRSDQELPINYIPKEYYDKYRLIFSHYNLDRKFARIGGNAKKKHKKKHTNGCRGFRQPYEKTNDSIGISGEERGIQKSYISSKIIKRSNFLN